MRTVLSILLLLLLCSGRPVLAQQRDSLKGAVYAAYLRREIEREDLQKNDKTQSVVVIPAPLAKKGSIHARSLLEVMTPPRLTRNDTVQAPDPAGLQWQLLPTGHRIKESDWEFKDWVRADTSLRSMGRQFDAFAQRPLVVAGPVAVPGVAVLLEGPDFFKSEK